MQRIFALIGWRSASGLRQRCLRLALWLFAICYLLCAHRAHAATEVTAYVWITNTPAGLPTNIVVNIGAADTRNWTNDATLAPATTIQITNSTAASATNLAAQLGSFPVYSAGAGSPQLNVALNATNTSVVNLTAPLNTNLTVTFGGNWAFVVYVTNTFAESVPIQSQTNAMSYRIRTNAVNAMVNLLATHPASNAVPLNSTFLRNYTDTNTAQTLGNKTLVAPVLQGGRITNAAGLHGTNFALTTGTVSAATISASTYSGTVGALTNGKS